MWGNYFTLGNSLDTLFHGQFKPFVPSLIGGLFIIAGMIGMLITGIYLDKSGNYKCFVRLIAVLLFLMMAIALVILPKGKVWVTCGWAAITGLIHMPILPSAYDYALKITGTTPPPIVNGMMMSGAFLWAFIGTISVTYLQEKNQVWGIFFLTASTAVALICTILFKEDKRMPEYVEVI